MNEVITAKVVSVDHKAGTFQIVIDPPLRLPVSSRPGEWDAVLPATRGMSHRSTTSSRFPGRAIEGSVAYELARIVACEHCGVMRRASPHPHAPRWWRNGTGTYLRIDCRGVEVAP